MLKKLNQKGMTVVELIVTFAIIMIIVVGMLEIIVALKNDMNDSMLERDIIEFQGTVTQLINDDLIKLKATKVSTCTFTKETDTDKGYCYLLSFSKQTISKKLEISLLNKYIKYDGIKYELPEPSIMEFRDKLIFYGDNVDHQVKVNVDDNNFLNIYIPFYIIDEDENIGIDIIHPLDL